MRKFFFVIFLFVGSGFSFLPIEQLSIGAQMPLANHKLKDVSGTEVTLEKTARANGLLVIFSCNTCPYVLKNQERTLNILQWALAKEVGAIVINSNEGTRSDEDSFEAMQAYAKQQLYPCFYAVDNQHQLADAFGANRTPECFLFDKSGKLVYHGAIDDSPSNAQAVKRKHLEEAINELAAGKEISIKTSRSIGCSIKRR